MSYEDIKYPKPTVFEGIYPGSSVLVIGSGPSTQNIVEYKTQLKDTFDVIVVLNYSFKFFDDVSDFHLVTEKTSKSSLNQVPVWLRDGNFNKQTPRVVNWKGIDQYPQDMNLHKLTRSKFDENSFNPRRYRNGDTEGLLVGPVSYQNFSLGSSVLCGMHFATMLGASSVYLIGADMLFRDEYDHWYKDRAYRNPAKGTKAINQHDIVDVECEGVKYKTTAYFRDSAKYIDDVIPTLFSGIDIYDFSKGLITVAKSVNVGEFFGV
jgi:hypothetical protein